MWVWIEFPKEGRLREQILMSCKGPVFRAIKRARFESPLPQTPQKQPRSALFLARPNKSLSRWANTALQTLGLYLELLLSSRIPPQTLEMPHKAPWCPSPSLALPAAPEEQLAPGSARQAAGTGLARIRWALARGRDGGDKNPLHG